MAVPSLPPPLEQSRVSRLGNSKRKVCAFALGLIYTGEPLQVMEQEARGVETVLQVSQPAAPPLLDSRVSGSPQGQVRYRVGPVPGVKTSQKPTFPSVMNQVDLSAPAAQVTYFQVTLIEGLVPGSCSRQGTGSASGELRVLQERNSRNINKSNPACGCYGDGALKCGHLFFVLMCEPSFHN